MSVGSDKIISSDIYYKIADYIDSKLYINNKWEKPDNLSSVVSEEDIIKSFSGFGYSNEDIKRCYAIIKNNIMGYKK